MDRGFARKSLDRGDRVAFGTKGGDQAAVHRLAIEKHGAGAAITGVATHLDSEMTELAQERAQALSGARGSRK